MISVYFSTGCFSRISNKLLFTIGEQLLLIPKTRTVNNLIAIVTLFLPIPTLLFNKFKFKVDYSKFEPRICVKCERRVQKHKPIIKCCICNNSYHPKCHILTPDDINTLIDNGLYHNWSCCNCNVNAIPLHYSDDSIIE